MKIGTFLILSMFLHGSFFLSLWSKNSPNSVEIQVVSKDKNVSINLDKKESSKIAKNFEKSDLLKNLSHSKNQKIQNVKKGLLRNSEYQHKSVIQSDCDRYKTFIGIGISYKPYGMLNGIPYVNITEVGIGTNAAQMGLSVGDLIEEDIKEMKKHEIGFKKELRVVVGGQEKVIEFTSQEICGT